MSILGLIFILTPVQGGSISDVEGSVPSAPSDGDHNGHPASDPGVAGTTTNAPPVPTDHLPNSDSGSGEPPRENAATGQLVSPGPMAPPVGSSSLLACIRRRESGTSGGYSAVSKNGKHYGAYQFSRSTWASVGGTGDPADASPAEQDARAWELYQRAGLEPWPPARNCA
jgi:hypothetical protein